MTFKPWVVTTAKIVKRAVFFSTLGLVAGFVIFFFYNLNRNVEALVKDKDIPVVVQVTEKVVPTATPSATIRPFRPVSPVISK